MDNSIIIAERKNKTLYQQGEKSIKVFDERFSKVVVLNEALNHARVEDIDINIPKLHDVTKIGNKWVISYDYIEGITMAKLMEKNPEKQDEYIDMFVDLQINIHNQKAPLLTNLKHKMERKIFKTDLEANIKFDLYARLNAMPDRTKVLHGDYNPACVVLSNDGKAYVLDWSHATQGNANEDVARSYLIFLLEKKDDIAEAYLNLYCKKTGANRCDILAWMPIVSASQLSKGIASEKEFLMSFINRTDI